MARYVSLVQFTDQGIRTIKDTIKRGEVAMAEAEKMDSVTRAAIARYQQEHGLYMTSVVDESTLAALGMNEFG